MWGADTFHYQCFWRKSCTFLYNSCRNMSELNLKTVVCTTFLLRICPLCTEFYARKKALINACAAFTRAYCFRITYQFLFGSMYLYCLAILCSGRRANAYRNIRNAHSSGFMIMYMISALAGDVIFRDNG